MANKANDALTRGMVWGLVLLSSLAVDCVLLYAAARVLAAAEPG